MATTVAPKPTQTEKPIGSHSDRFRTAFPLLFGSRKNIRRHWWRDARRVLVLVAGDMLTFVALRTLVAFVRSGSFGSGAAALADDVFAEGFLGGWKFAVALILSLLIAGAYGAGELRRDTGRVLAGAALAALISLYHTAWEQHLLLVAIQFAAVVAVTSSAIAGTRYLIDLIVQRVRGPADGARTVLLAHEGANWARINEIMEAGKELTIVAELRLSDRVDAGLDTDLATLEHLIHSHGADTVLLWTDLNDDEFAYAVDVALASGCRLLAGPRAPTAVPTVPRAVWVSGQPLTELTTPRLQAWQLFLKRGLDIVGAGVGLLMLSPVFAAIGVWIKFDSRGPVFFRQTRMGARGREFKMVKFRSMRTDAEALLDSDPELGRLFKENGFKIPAELDPRVSRAGRFLRKTSLDELPQLFNVLAGSMSLVGPRPIEPVEFNHSGHHYGMHGLPVFLSAKPGMTGAWAVSGRSDVGYPDRAQLELEYVRTWSLATDLLILLKTLPAIASGRGAH